MADSKSLADELFTFRDKFEEDQAQFYEDFTDSLKRQHDDIEGLLDVLRARNVAIDEGIKQEKADRIEQIEKEVKPLQARLDRIEVMLQSQIRDRECIFLHLILFFQWPCFVQLAIVHFDFLILCSVPY